MLGVISLSSASCLCLYPTVEDGLSVFSSPNTVTIGGGGGAYLDTQWGFVSWPGWAILQPACLPACCLAA